MKQGLKKFTVPYEGHYFDGGRIFGQRVVFAEDAKAATAKVQKTFDDKDDEPIVHAGIATKWEPGEISKSEIYPYWGMDG